MSELSRRWPAASGRSGPVQALTSAIHLCCESIAVACRCPEGSSLQVLITHAHCLLNLRRCCPLELQKGTGRATC